MSDAAARHPGLASGDWAGATSRGWSEHADHLEAMLAPVDELLLPAASITPGEHVLDIGCGRGVTTRAAAVATGPTGAVTGIDISPTLIADARSIEASGAPIDWVVADAGAHPFEPAAADVLLSRFGVMFFDDPSAAFANLRRAMRPSGRLAVAVWPRQDASEFQWLAVDTAVRVAGAHGLTLQPDPPDAGPFAYGDARRTAPLLERAGWRDVTVTHHELLLYVGGPGTTPEDAVAMGLRVGPFGMLLRHTPDDVRAAAAEALIVELRARRDGTGAPLLAQIAIVTARCDAPAPNDEERST